ncbi:MAG: glycosyltransferase family 4 protein [Lysobacterales bacterium]|nr:MAG: glycosyltransferase family 4 protein [Xanthomonadales bacterium]
MVADALAGNLFCDLLAWRHEHPRRTEGRNRSLSPLLHSDYFLRPNTILADKWQSHPHSSRVSFDPNHRVGADPKGHAALRYERLSLSPFMPSQWRDTQRADRMESNVVMSPPLITIVLYFFRLATAGGAERIICQLANAMVERRFRVHLVSLDSNEAAAFYPLNTGVRWTKIGYRPGILDKLRRTLALVRLLKVNDVHALVGFVMSGDKSIFTAAKLSGVRLAAAERNAPAMYRLRYSRVQRWISFGLLHLADRIVVQMPEYVNGYPVSLRNKILTIANPVSMARQHARPDRRNASGRFTLLAVSRLDPVQKRIGTLIGAFSHVARTHPDWDLRIIGDGPGELALRRLAEELGISERVRMEPSVTSVFDAYAEAHLFVMPSLWEGFPNALAEAMSHGLPAVGFDAAAGVADLIRKGGGWLAPGLDDAASLAETLSIAMDDHTQRAIRGKLAAQGMAVFTPEAVFDRWAEMLLELGPKQAL